MVDAAAKLWGVARDALALCIADFDHYGTHGAIPAVLDEERARQAALGHRALQALVKLVDAGCITSPIIDELRGRK